jgi:hypothetical protein
MVQPKAKSISDFVDLVEDFERAEVGMVVFYRGAIRPNVDAPKKDLLAFVANAFFASVFCC